MDVVSWTLGNCQYDQEKPILIDANDTRSSISASQARIHVRKLIAGFRAAGVNPGDCVCIISFSNVMYPIFYLGIIGAGCRVVGGNPGHTVFETCQTLSVCNVRLVVTEPGLLDKVQRASKGCEVPPVIYVYGGSDFPSETGIRPWTDLEQSGEGDWVTLDAEEAKKEVAAYFSTSGTTGAPKYAAVSHGYFVRGGMNIEADVSTKPYPIARLVSLPLMHAFAAPLVIVGALRCGTPTYLMARFSAKAFLQALPALEITEIPVVPSMLSALLSDPAFDAQYLESLHEVMSAGAPLGKSLATRFESLLPEKARLIQLYGLTEAGWIASVPYQEQACRKDPTLPWTIASAQGCSESDSDGSAGSLDGASTPDTPDTPITSRSDFLSADVPTIGSALPGYSLALLDTETNQIVSTPKTLGEVLIRAPHPFLSYLGAADATAAAFIEIRDPLSDDRRLQRFIRSGDIAYFDVDGDYFVVDRLKDLIKVRGWQVSPAELESVLLHYPGIADAAVVGLPDPEGISGELPHAFVVKAKNQALGIGVTEEDLKRWVKSRLAAYKAIASVRFVESVPRNPAGKILRRLLRETS